jgi:hypothetical protein
MQQNFPLLACQLDIPGLSFVVDRHRRKQKCSFVRQKSKKTSPVFQLALQGIKQNDGMECLPAIDGKRIAVWFSCGAASAVAAKKTLELYGSNNDVRIINNPVAEEDDDNRRFLLDVQEWLGVPIEIALNKNYPSGSAVDVWEKRRFMSGPTGAPCTQELKKKARQQWEEQHRPDYHVLGFTAEEKARHERFTLTERTNVIPVLIDLGITKADCFRIVSDAGLALPAVYLRGYPNANCLGCVKATSPTYWNHVRKQDPQVFEARALQSRDIGARLVRHKGQRIFLDELPENAKGHSMKGLDFECGIFCEERKF